MLKVQVIGRAGKDSVINDVNGRKVINFPVAHTEKFKDSHGNQQEKTTWIECAIWGDKTKIADYLKKGTQIYAEGTPDVKSFTKNDGSAGTSLTLRILKIELLGGKSDSASQQPKDNSNHPAVSGNATGFDDDDNSLPF